MSAVSRKVMPASSAASTTARVRSRSSLPPKLLQPRPTRVTWRPLESSSCEYMLHSLSPMRVWIDITNSPHVLVFRPLIALLRQRGAEVEVTSRDYAQTVQLLELQGIHAEILGAHGGRGRLGKAKAMVSRMRALFAWAQGRRFDVALAHGSHELTLTARRLGIPSATTFDYEFAWLQHQLGCRAATRVVVPEAIPPERLERYGVEEPKLRRYPGLKEEYYLADFEPDPAALGHWEIDPARTLVVVRTPPDVWPCPPAGGRPPGRRRRVAARGARPPPPQRPAPPRPAEGRGRPPANPARPRGDAGLVAKRLVAPRAPRNRSARASSGPPPESRPA